MAGGTAWLPSQAPAQVAEQERRIEVDVARERHRLEALAHVRGQGEPLEFLAQAHRAGLVRARFRLGKQAVDPVAEQEAGLAAIAGQVELPATVLGTIGEEAGALDTMLFKVAEYFEQEVNNAVDALSSLIEPFIMVIIGTLVGGMVIGMYLPIFKLAATI